MTLEAQVAELLALRADEQADALDQLLLSLPWVDAEDWNLDFASDSWFDAWCQTTVCSRARAHVAGELRPFLDQRPGWRMVDVGVGDGRLWREVLRSDERGELILVDPSHEALIAASAGLPSGVTVHRLQTGIEHAWLPVVDGLVCSMSLHHLAGRSQQERELAGLPGPGKGEVLEGFADILRARDGRGWLVEADIHCEVDLPPFSELLRDNLLDSYVRRCARSIADDLQRVGVPRELAQRWRAVLRHWCLEQVGKADRRIEARDVYELDVERWLQLLEASGLNVEQYGFTDDYGLFCCYRFATSTVSRRRAPSTSR